MQRQYRLKRRAAFQYVYRKGDSASAGDVILLCARSREGLKIGLSVSKKVGGAVVRNRVKRLLRAAIDPILDSIDAKYMYVLVARPSLAGKSYDSVCASVRSAFERAGRLK